MMRGPQKMALAVRTPAGEIVVEESAVKTHAIGKIPFLRGVFNFCYSLIDGYKCLMRSADLSMGEATQPDKVDLWLEKHFGDKGMNVIMGVAAVLGGFLAIGMFMLLPTFLVGLLSNVVPLGGFKTLIEGVLKIAILVLYMFGVSKMPDIARMFRYHGAEHKTIACYEAGLPLTIENVRPCTRLHPRCGTSFLLIVLIVSVLLNSVLPWTSTGLRVVYKILMLPIVMSISYEIIKWCGKSDSWFARAVSRPGMWLQHITTSEPDDGMIECAVAAMKPVLPVDKEEGKW